MVPKALALESAGHDKGVGVGQVLAIDVGGTFIKYALVDEGGVLTGKGRVPTPLEGLDDFIDTVESIYQVFHGQVEGIALSVPGVVDRDAGFMHSGGALEYNYGVPLAALLQERMPGVSVSIENDAKAAVWAEMTSGAHRGLPAQVGCDGHRRGRAVCPGWSWGRGRPGSTAPLLFRVGCPDPQHLVCPRPRKVRGWRRDQRAAAVPGDPQRRDPRRQEVLRRGVPLAARCSVSVFQRCQPAWGCLQLQRAVRVSLIAS